MYNTHQSIKSEFFKSAYIKTNIYILYNYNGI